MHVPRERPCASAAPLKAYKNPSFLNGPHARNLRIQCEFEEPRIRLEENNVTNIVMIFGSARSKNPEEYRSACAELREKVKSDPSVQPQLTRMERMSFLCRYHEETIKLSRLITEFSQSRLKEGLPQYTVGTGAGPGMMEAANEGAHRAGGKSVGFGISLPFETGLNPYVTPELGFEFHYFFTRKFWMAYKCMGLVVAPGGYGTCDELFEILTLIQTGKIPKKLPVILFGQEYWDEVFGKEKFKVMEEYGLLTVEDLNSLVFTCDTAEAAFEHLKSFWLSDEAQGCFQSPKRKLVYEPSDPAKKLRLDAPKMPERPNPPKAYKNLEFIKSSHSRIFRIQCEFEETALRLDAENIKHMVLFIGSGSVKNHDGHLKALSDAARDPVKNAKTLDLLSRQQPLLKYHQVSRDLARSITAWSLEREKAGKDTYTVATGGGPGLNEGANEGAWEAGGKSIGLGGGRWGFNKYVTPELAFLFHYFFTRKFWMAYRCMGVVALPGAFGTCDELFEILTLMQTGKIRRKLPIVLIGTEFWQRAVCWKKMADYGMISDSDVSQLCFTDSAEHAFQFITKFWEAQEVDGHIEKMPSKDKK
eukprot:TRINITY_DN68_c0_g1_i3.p1 TRINITY_DN68_c0_g1~~TRINITY_DN68_c0_g1_i3.p1  ORF type:complete len:589 (+),score=172.45 TRINITY_DN68_c0_g1_i3:71-1837(+)